MYRRRSGSGVWHRTAVILNRNQRRSSKARISETLLREKVQRIVPNDGTKEDLERALDALLTTLDTTALAKG